jgi:signal peptidase I
MRHTQVYKFRQHSWFARIATVLLLAASIGGLGLWRTHDTQMLSVQSNSMVPVVRRGDAVVLHTIKDSDLKTGDIVSYRSLADQNVIITHRIVNVEKTWGLIITKGDNTQRDDTPVPMSNVMGKVDFRVAYAGFLLNALRSPLGLALGVYLPALIIIAFELKRLASFYTKPTYRLLAYTKH